MGALKNAVVSGIVFSITYTIVSMLITMLLPKVPFPFSPLIYPIITNGVFNIVNFALNVLIMFLVWLPIYILFIAKQ